MTVDVISKDLKTSLRRLRLSPLLATLPDRLALARKKRMPHQDFLLLLLQDEVSRREGNAVARRAQRARLDAESTFESWDDTSDVSYDEDLLGELKSGRFVEACLHVGIYGPVGVGKTFLAQALGHVACQAGRSVSFLRHDQLLKTLRHARLDNSYEAELLKLLAVDLLIVDDFALDAMGPQESRDTYEVLVERHRAGSVILTSNRGPDEWIATFTDPIRAQAAIDRFTSRSFDLVLEGESYRRRLKPTVAGLQSGQIAKPASKGKRRSRKKSN